MFSRTEWETFEGRVFLGIACERFSRPAGHLDRRRTVPFILLEWSMWKFERRTAIGASRHASSVFGVFSESSDATCDHGKTTHTGTSSERLVGDEHEIGFKRPQHSSHKVKTGHVTSRASVLVKCHPQMIASCRPDFDNTTMLFCRGYDVLQLCILPSGGFLVFGACLTTEIETDRWRTGQVTHSLRSGSMYYSTWGGYVEKTFVIDHQLSDRRVRVLLETVCDRGLFHVHFSIDWRLSVYIFD